MTALIGLVGMLLLVGLALRAIHHECDAFDEPRPRWARVLYAVAWGVVAAYALALWWGAS